MQPPPAWHRCLHVLFLLLAGCLRSAPPPALPAEIEVAPLGRSRPERRAVVQDLREAFSRQRDTLRRHADRFTTLSRSTQRWLALPIEVDAAVLSSPDPASELSVRFLERAFARHGFLLLRAQAQALLGRWKTHPHGDRLRDEIAQAQQLGRPILYRGDVASAFRDYTDMLRQHARELEEALERLSQQRYAEEGIQSFYIAHYNALVLVLQGLGDLPVAPLNLLRRLEGQERIPGLGQWLARCQERVVLGPRGAPPRAEIDRSAGAPCVLRTLPYVGEYGQKYGSSLETGALLGMMSQPAGAVIQSALTKTLGPGVRWLSTQAGEGGAQLVRMLGWWLHKGGQAFAIEAAIDVGRGLRILWRGGEELPDGRFEPLGPEDAMELLQRILVQLGVAKNVKELFEKTSVEERERAGSREVLTSAIRPQKPVPPVEVMKGWLGQFERKRTPRGEPEYEYEVRYTGPENIKVQGGGQEIWADGARLDGLLQEAKHVDKPARSPYVPESSCPDFVRAKALKDLNDELERYTAVIQDPTTPAWGLEIITNHPSAALFFLRRMEYYQLPGRVVVRP